MKKLLFLLSLLASQIVNAATPITPFRDAVVAGNMLYLSGQIGAVKDPNTGALTVVPGGIVAETRQAMENIKNVLAKYNSSLDHVVKCTVFMADMKEWTQMNDVYASYFQAGLYPARSAFGASGIAFNGRVEIECIATLTSMAKINS